MFDVCVLGHVTRDLVRMPGRKARSLPGGAAYYAAMASARLGLSTALVTRLADADFDLLAGLARAGVQVTALKSAATTTFETRYGGDLDVRTQTAVAVADAFAPADARRAPARAYVMDPLAEAEDFGPLLAAAAERGGPVALDLQGFVRKFLRPEVPPRVWQHAARGLARATIVKADTAEAAALTGETEPNRAAKALAGLGPREVIVTMGSRGSLLHAEGGIHAVPAFAPKRVVDPTGCGDSYLAGYVALRLEGKSALESARFGAALASLKIAYSGPFKGTRAEVEWLLARATD